MEAVEKVKIVFFWIGIETNDLGGELSVDEAIVGQLLYEFQLKYRLSYHF
jgi:hypothetical protein